MASQEEEHKTISKANGAQRQMPVTSAPGEAEARASLACMDLRTATAAQEDLSSKPQQSVDTIVSRTYPLCEFKLSQLHQVNDSNTKESLNDPNT